MIDFRPSNETIVTELESIVGKGNVLYGIREMQTEQNELVIYFPTELDATDPCNYKQEMNIIYISRERETLREDEFLNIFKKVGLFKKGVDYSHYMQGEAVVDIVLYKVVRRGK